VKFLYNSFDAHHTFIEIAIFARGCPSRRVENMQVLRQRIAALESERNAHHCTISWRFTFNDSG
jgi:hypothetical protein